MSGVSVILRVLAVGAVLSTSACDWPVEGAGGLAERQNSSIPAVEEAHARLDRLSEAGGEKYAAADMVEARVLLARVQRQYVGGLTTAADSDMTRLNATLDQIDERLKAPPTLPRGVSTSSTAAPTVLHN
jgi:hypothetical protein